jgi:hypothetical protein
MAGTVAVCFLNLIIVLSPLEDTQSEAVDKGNSAKRLSSSSSEVWQPR